MAKQPELTVMPVIGFYHPRPRIGDYTGEVTNPITGEVTTPPSMTKQEFVAECDINNIVKEYLITGQVQHIAAKAAQGQYLDLPQPMDFQESVHVVMQAQQAFESLPSRVRERFGNDPEQFLQFFYDPANADEARELGMLPKLAPGGAPPPPAPPPQEPPTEPQK